MYLPIKKPYDPAIPPLDMDPKELKQELEQIFVHPCFYQHDS